jgi:peptidoglycan-associated lipoprotein
MRNSVKIVTMAFASLMMACPPQYPKCESDEHCKEKGEVCVQGQCVECATSDGCKPGFVCEANKCAPKPECVGDGACGAGRKCMNGKCAVDPNAKAPGTCATTNDCASGEECKAGRCAPAAVASTLTDACTFESIRFEFNEYNLSTDVQQMLARYADCIKKQSLRFTLEGNADERGTEEYNMVLSQKRAASVRKYLVDLGVTGGALDTVGFGENKPAVSGSGESAWAANRRVEFKKR